jgi:hypothetical protein
LFKIKGEEIELLLLLQLNFLYDYNSAWLLERRAIFPAPFILIPKSPSLDADYITKLGFKEHVSSVECLENMFLSSVIK